MHGLKPYCARATDIFCVASKRLQDQKISHRTLDTPVCLAKLEKSSNSTEQQTLLLETESVEGVWYLESACVPPGLGSG